jgi:SPW repeat
MTNEALKRSLRATSGLDVALGLWLFVSPWVFGTYSRPRPSTS